MLNFLKVDNIVNENFKSININVDSIDSISLYEDGKVDIFLNNSSYIRFRPSFGELEKILYESNLIQISDNSYNSLINLYWISEEYLYFNDRNPIKIDSNYYENIYKHINFI